MIENNIDISKDTFIRRLIIFQLGMVLCFLFLIDNFGLPAITKYIMDIVWIILLIAILFSRRKVAYINLHRNWILLFFFYVLVTLMINHQSFSLFMWGMRNNFRFYVFFLACALFLRKKDIHRVLKTMLFFYYVNFLLCLYQYYFLGFTQDRLGGIFGTQAGCNGYTNLFLVIICAYEILSYVYKKTGFIKCFFLVACGCYVAVLSELKIFFVELIIITLLVILFAKFSWRKLILIIGGVCVLILAINILYEIFPQWRNFFTVSSIYNNISNTRGYTGAGDLNRLSAISSINQIFFRNNTPLHFIGYGLGSCEFSSNFEFLVSHFYSVYLRFHYVWLSNAWMYLETGYIGLIFFNGFFIIGFIVGRKTKPESAEEHIAVNLARITSICCIIIAIYNVSLRMECGYLAYFVLSIPLIIQKERDRTPINVESLTAGCHNSYLRPIDT